MQKNVAGQKYRVFAWDVTTNLPATGDAANITAKLKKDWGAIAPVTDTNPTETEDGYYEFNISQAESNANVLDLYPESSTADIQVIGVPGSLVTTPPNYSAMGIESDGDISKVNLCDVNTDMRGTDNAALDATVAKTGADGDTLETLSDQMDGLATDIAAIPVATVISNLLGTINVSYAEEAGSVTIKRGDVINVPVIIQSDLTGKRLFYGARKYPSSSSYTMGDDAGGANEIELINITVVDSVTTGFIPFDGTNNDVEACTYKSEVEARDADGLSNPVTAISFDTIVKGDIIR